MSVETEALVRLALKLSPEDARLLNEALTRAEEVGRAEGYEAGFRAGKERGALRRRAARPGSPRWNRIYSRGNAA